MARKQKTIRERSQRNVRDSTASVTAAARDRAIERAVAPLERRIERIEHSLGLKPRAVKKR